MVVAGQITAALEWGWGEKVMVAVKAGTLAAAGMELVVPRMRSPRQRLTRRHQAHLTHQLQSCYSALSPQGCQD